MNYSQAVEYLQSFPDMERGTHGSRGPTMSLESMRSLLRRLGNPQNGRHTVHITGSKGKGSTAAMIGSIFSRAGLKTASFTSPHLHSYTERIAFDMEPVSEELFARGLAEIKPFVDQELENGLISTFGVLTALFFHLVKTAEPAVEWQIVEVGMGGRYDATNVFEAIDLAVVTAISLEHVEILGATQSEIATNKAGIIIPGCTTILAPQKDRAVRSVIGRQCHQVGARLVDVGDRMVKIKQLSHDLTGQQFSLESNFGQMELRVPILGAHQISNAATAATAAKVLIEQGVKISDADIAEGLASCQIMGRLEILSPGALNGAGAGPAIVADGAHNHESAHALAEAIKSLYQGKKCIFVIGVNVDKNINAIWRELNPLSKTVITTRSRNLRAMDPKSVADAVTFQSNEEHAETTDSVAEAVELAKTIATPEDLICITGSLYVVAEARECLNKHER